MVELRYESWSLQVGLVVSLTAYLALTALTVTRARRRWKSTDETLIDNAP
jgi:hypothetical protein